MSITANHVGEGNSVIKVYYLLKFGLIIIVKSVIDMNLNKTIEL